MLEQAVLRCMRVCLVLLPLCLVLGACGGLRDSPASTWPDELPPVSYFVSAYDQDAELKDYQSLREYLSWVRSFYEGTVLYPRGWTDLSDDILRATDKPALFETRKRELGLLGRDIAAEWAKDNDIRRVDNRHLAVWGGAASRAINEENVDEILDKIGDDLEKLLAAQLPPDAIHADRYHDPDPDDWFAF